MSLMSKSGLPCYGRGHPLENLKKRFHLEMSDSQAAALMRKTVHDAYDKVHSRFPSCKRFCHLDSPHLLARQMP